MRISDWSSDVCSSDLVDDAARSEMLHGLPNGVAPHPVTRGEFGFDKALAGNHSAGLEITENAEDNGASRSRRLSARPVLLHFNVPAPCRSSLLFHILDPSSDYPCRRSQHAPSAEIGQA